jgi:peroxiredoxin
VFRHAVAPFSAWRTCEQRIAVAKPSRPFAPTGDGMTIKVGDKLPAGTLSEFIEVETAGCAVGPNTFKIDDLARGKKVAVFGVPGAFTPTCSAKHVPSYLANIDKLKAKGVSDVICMSVNDAFVMGAWARDQKTGGKIRMMGDGSADYTKALGLEFDLAAKGLGLRCQRFSMLVDDGVVKVLNIEAPGKYEVSDAETLLKQMG